jgi:hypothetical protein
MPSREKHLRAMAATAIKRRHQKGLLDAMAYRFRKLIEGARGALRTQGGIDELC